MHDPGCGRRRREAPDMSVSLEPPYDALDRSGMLSLIAGASRQIRDAFDGTPAWSPPRRAPDLLAVGAMGGSAIAADLTAAITRDRLPRPMLVVRDYRFPACVTSSSLAVVAA